MHVDTGLFGLYCTYGVQEAWAYSYNPGARGGWANRRLATAPGLYAQA